MCFGTLDCAPSIEEGPLVGATFARPPQVGHTGEAALAGQVPMPAPPSPIRAAADHVFTTLSARLPRLLGSSPTQERFRDVTFSLANVVLQLAGEESLSWQEFAAGYAAMYPDRQPSLPAPRRPLRGELGEPITQALASGLGSLKLATSDPSRECFMCPPPRGMSRSSSTPPRTSKTTPKRETSIRLLKLPFHGARLLRHRAPTHP